MLATLARFARPSAAARRILPPDDPGAALRDAVPELKRGREIVKTAPTVKDGRERSALFGRYPTRTKLNYAASRQRGDKKAAWRLDPVSVMETTPLRRCCVTAQPTRTAYMVNLRGVLVRGADGESRAMTMPDRILHPRFVSRRTGAGAWVTLRPEIVADLSKRGKRALASLTGGPPKVNDQISEQITAELGERVAQELELVRARIASAAPVSNYRDLHRILRPLSSSEMEGLQSGIAPEGAIAILDVRFGAQSKLTWEEKEHPKVPMLRRMEGGQNEDPEHAGDVPLFPLHALLGANPRVEALVEDVLAAEMGFRRRCEAASGEGKEGATAQVEEFRTEEQAPFVAVQIPELEHGQGGGVPLVIALWRVALWRGEGWEVLHKPEEGADEGEGKD